LTGFLRRQTKRPIQEQPTRAGNSLHNPHKLRALFNCNRCLLKSLDDCRLHITTYHSASTAKAVTPTSRPHE
jgi:hypothetical protein